MQFLLLLAELAFLVLHGGFESCVFLLKVRELGGGADQCRGVTLHLFDLGFLLGDFVLEAGMLLLDAAQLIF